MRDDLGPTGDIRQWLDRKLALAVRHPAPTFAFAGLTAQDFNLFGDHEGRIETDSELPDQAHVLARVARELTDKGRGAGPSDRAEIVYQFFAVHADAVIGDRKRAAGLIGS